MLAAVATVFADSSAVSVLVIAENIFLASVISLYPSNTRLAPSANAIALTAAF